MASITLAESAKLTQNSLIAGVIENIVTINPFYQILPFDAIDGKATSYNRENTLGTAEWIVPGAGTEITTGKSASTFETIETGLKVLIGDAEVDSFIQANHSNFTDQKAAQIAGKAKSIGMQYQDKMINGTGGNEIEGLLSLVGATQTVEGDTNGSPLSFDLLDQLLDKVTDRHGMVDYIMMNRRTIRAYKAMYRTLGGAGIAETMQMPAGATILSYGGVPIFANDYIPVDQTQGTSTDATSIMAGTIDDGTHKVGISGLTSQNNSGITITDIGESETKDMSITRVKFYNGLALYNNLGLAMLKGITN